MPNVLHEDLVITTPRCSSVADRVSIHVSTGGPLSPRKAFTVAGDQFSFHDLGFNNTFSKSSEGTVI
jgi:hypothetical protein